MACGRWSISANPRRRAGRFVLQPVRLCSISPTAHRQLLPSCSAGEVADRAGRRRAGRGATVTWRLSRFRSIRSTIVVDSVTEARHLRMTERNRTGCPQANGPVRSDFPPPDVPHGTQETPSACYPAHVARKVFSVRYRTDRDSAPFPSPRRPTECLGGANHARLVGTVTVCWAKSLFAAASTTSIQHDPCAGNEKCQPVTFKLSGRSQIVSKQIRFRWKTG